MEKERLVALVTAAQRGNSDAMNELFGAFYNDVYYFALKTVKNEELACDITQEAFVEILQTIGDLQAPAAFVTWMRQITYHQCTRYFKKKKEFLVEEDEDGNTVFDTLQEENGEFIPDEALDKAEFKSTVLALLDTLSEEQRSAVMMYYFDEIPVKEIAAIQGVSEGTVKSRLNYARKSIRGAVEDYEKKTGVRLHAVPFLPLLRWVLEGTLEKGMPLAAAKTVAAGVSAATGIAVSAGAGASAAGAAAAVGGAAVGIGAKLAAIPIGLKIVAGLTAASLVLGGIPAAILLSRSEERAETEETATEAVAVIPSTEEADTEEAEWALEGVIPEGGSYLCADGRRLEAGEPFPASPTAGDRLYLADYVYSYEGVSKIRMEGKDEVHLWRDGFDDGDSGMNESDAFGTWFPIALENKESYSPIASSIIGKPIRALNGTFANCTRLALAPRIPSTVTTVAGAFFGCTALRSAPVLPESVERYTGAFYGCTALEGDVVFLGGLDRTSEYYGDSVFRDTVNAINLVGTCPEEDLITIAILSDNTKITVHGKAVFAAGGPDEVPSVPDETPEQEEAASVFVVPSGCRYVSVDGTVASEGERVNLVRGDRLEDATYAYFYQEAYRYEEKEGAWVMTGRGGDGFLPMVLDRTAASYGEFHPLLAPQITQLYETFADCTNLTVSPEIPEGVTALIETFRNCRRLRVTPRIPDGVTNLFEAFYGCTSLKTVTNLPKEALGMHQCFYGCTSLTEVPSEFPDKVQDLTNVFCGCTSLVTVPSEIPASVRNVTGAFFGCKSLSRAPLFAGFVENMDVMYSGCESLTETPQFPVGIKSMQGSFSDCTSLVTVHALPSTLEDMNSAFSGCVLLGYMSPIPNSVRSMVGAFTDCTSLVKTPVLPEGVEDLSRAFMGCTALVSSDSIPSTVKRMENTFSECTALASAPLLPEGVENISGVFYGCELIESVEYIPSTVTDMSRAFAYCSALSGTIRVEALSLTAETVSGAFVRAQNEILLVGGSPHLSLIREHGGSGLVELG